MNVAYNMDCMKAMIKILDFTQRKSQSHFTDGYSSTTPSLAIKSLILI